MRQAHSDEMCLSFCDLRLSSSALFLTEVYRHSRTPQDAHRGGWTYADPPYRNRYHTRIHAYTDIRDIHT